MSDAPGSHDKVIYTYAPRCDYELPELIEFTLEPANWGGGLTGFEISTGGEKFGQLYRSEHEALEKSGKHIQFIVDFWADKLAHDRSNKAVIQQTHYSVLPDYSASGTNFAGHGGREFMLRPLTVPDTIIVTHNLWCQGRVPDWFRAHFPDTHEFVYPIPGTDPAQYTNDPDIAFPPAKRFEGWEQIGHYVDEAQKGKS